MEKPDNRAIILEMSYRDIAYSLIISQLLFLTIGFILSFFLFEFTTVWTRIISFSWQELLFYGVLPGLAVVAVDLGLMKLLPENTYDDGGLNKKLFSEAPVVHIFFLSFLVAICEEILFRGVIQTAFGIYISSIVFALVHFRYLKKPALFLSVVGLSFLLGISFQLTGNLLVPIIMHFTIDLLLGLIIHQKEKSNGRAL